VVAVEARKHADAAGGRAGADQVPAGPAGPVPRGASVITLPRRAAPLPCDGRPAPSVTAYDQLLARRGEKGGA
jgi:hypothetical protein